MMKETREKHMKIKKHQIRKLLSQFATIYDMQQKMSKSLNGGKTFALDGRLIGDMGECLVSYLYGVDLEETQTPGQDGTLNDKPVEIKVRTKNEKGRINHVHISDATITKNGCYLFVLSFDPDHKQVEVTISAWLSKSELKKIKRTDKGFATLSNLKQCVTLNCCDDCKKKKMAGWTIYYKEVL